MSALLQPIPSINPILLKMAQHGIAARANREKQALIPGGGDPSMAGGAPPPGGAAPPPPDPSGGMGGAAVPPAGPGGDQSTQIAQQVAAMMAQGGGAAGKGKSPKDQIAQGQAKIQIHLLAQIASKMGIQVDPQLLVPATDPATDQLAMQETQNANMVPSNDPNAGAAGAGDPNAAAAGGAPPGPAPIQPMDASSGPIGKTAGLSDGAYQDLLSSFDIGVPFPATQMPAPTPTPTAPFELDAVISGAQKIGSLAARTRRTLGYG